MLCNLIFLKASKNNFCDFCTITSGPVSAKTAHLGVIFFRVNLLSAWRSRKTSDIYMTHHLNPTFSKVHSTLEESSHRPIYTSFFFFHNGGYWLTDPFPGFRRWARRLPLEPQWEPSWQLLSIRPSSTPSSKATREVSIPRVCHSAGRAPVIGSAALIKFPLTYPQLATAAFGFDPTSTSVLILSVWGFSLIRSRFSCF